jgi:3-oxoacyl-[acyl-carrier-protein] synthase II
MKKVVITGIGVVTPIGNNIETTWENLTKGISGIELITKFDAAALPSRIAGELKNFRPEDYIPQKDILRLDPFIHYAAAAAIMAVEDAGLIHQTSDIRRQTSDYPTYHSSLDSAGIVIGSSRGGIMSMEKAIIRTQNLPTGQAGTEYRTQNNASRLSAYLMSSTTISMASSYISMRFGIKGPALGISTACASGTNAIGEAMRLIRSGEIDLAIAGGSEAPVCRLAVGGYGASGALSKRNHEPEKASRPFDAGRDGFVIAEGAGVVVLEELEHALKRNARIYAELAGYGTCSDAFHQTKPDSGGEAAAIEKALKNAGVSANEIEYINCHATSTVIGDISEAEAIEKVFRERTCEIPISSSKSMLGHMLGGAGAVEAVITAVSVSKGLIIPTINLENPDPDCKLNHVTSLTNKKINAAISNSFGFGGVNAVLVFKKYI